MKKLFFASALAVLAIGGAVSSVTATTFYTLNTGTHIAYHCDGGTLTCASQIGSTPVYSTSTSPQTLVNPITYADLKFTSQSSY